MRIHSDVLTAEDLSDALKVTGLAAEGVWLAEMSRHGSRSHRVGYEVALRGTPGKDRNGKARRAPNSGSYGADAGKAATYDEWGFWLAELYERDPEAKMTYYRDRNDFHRQTRNAYRVAQEA